MELKLNHRRTVRADWVRWSSRRRWFLQRARVSRHAEEREGFQTNEPTKVEIVSVYRVSLGLGWSWADSVKHIS